MKKPIIIFDFDGTIVDSLDVVTEIFEHLSGQIKNLDDPEIDKLRHLPLNEVAKRLDVPFWKVPYLVLYRRKLMSQRISEIKPFPGMANLIKSLHGEGYTLLIVSSNSLRNVSSFLKIHELRQYFYRVYGNVGIFNKAQALRKLIRKNRLSLEDCIYVADETRDIKACKTTGIRCVAVNWGFADPTLLAELKPYGFVTTPNELKQLIVNDNNKVVGA